MTKQNAIKVFEEKKVRTVWDSDKEEWYFSIVDVIEILTEQPNHQGARNYWKVLKNRMSKEGNETVTNCNRLKLPAEDGKMRLTDVADTEQLFRLIQSIPSPKAEPFKLWMAQVAKERLDRMQDPELSIQQAMLDYKRLGYSDNWINQRLKSIEIRKDLTDEWKRHGLQEGVQFATLTDIIYKTWAGKTGCGKNRTCAARTRTVGIRSAGNRTLSRIDRNAEPEILCIGSRALRAEAHNSVQVPFGKSEPCGQGGQARFNIFGRDAAAAESCLRIGWGRETAPA